MTFEFVICFGALISGQMEVEAAPAVDAPQAVVVQAVEEALPAEEAATEAVAEETTVEVDEPVVPVVPVTSPATTDAELLSQLEKDVVRRTNAERVRRGLCSLEIDLTLMKNSRSHCSWMARTRRFVHSHMGCAENIARGQRSGASVLQSWMNSQGHRANILNPSHRRIGVAVYRTSGGDLFWCQQFLRGRPIRSLPLTEGNDAPSQVATQSVPTPEEEADETVVQADAVVVDEATSENVPAEEVEVASQKPTYTYPTYSTNRGPSRSRRIFR
jgi:uncharacterized protein YkwD